MDILDPNTIENSIVDLDYCSIETFEYGEEKGEFLDNVRVSTDIYAISNVERMLQLEVSKRRPPCRREIELTRGFLDTSLRK